MNGHLIPHTPIAVDFWKPRTCPRAKVFFLTHMHTDHTNGLTSSWQLPIYCSELSKKLLIHKFQIKEALICILELNTPHIIPLDSDSGETMTVSAIDANHCPGSVMLLFEGYFGTILYTGDFRYTPDMFVETPLSSAKSIDILYLDNTYCSSTCDFPSRAEAKRQIIKIIEDHPEDNVLIGVRQLGKEDLLADLAKHFSTYIVVNQDQYKKLEILEADNVFTTDFDAGFIHAVPAYQITEKSLLEWNMERPTIGILPSALYVGVPGNQYKNKSLVHAVPYSDHSSYQELHEFVAMLKPRSVRPIVEERRGVLGCDMTSRRDMNCFSEHLDASKAAKFTVPESVQRFMSCKNSPTVSRRQSILKAIPRTVAAAKLHRKPLYQVKKTASVSKGIVYDNSPLKNPSQSGPGPAEGTLEVQCEEVGSTLKIAPLKIQTAEGSDSLPTAAKDGKGCNAVGYRSCTTGCSIVESDSESEDTKDLQVISTSEKGSVSYSSGKRQQEEESLRRQKVRTRKDGKAFSPLKFVCVQRLKHQGSLSKEKRNSIYRFLNMDFGKSEDIINPTRTGKEKDQIETINLASDVENDEPTSKAGSDSDCSTSSSSLDLASLYNVPVVMRPVLQRPKKGRLSRILRRRCSSRGWKALGELSG